MSEVTAVKLEKKKIYRVLAFSCSPSKGFNSDIMLDNFVNGLKEVADKAKQNGLDLQIEKIYLNDIKIANYSFFNRVPEVEKEPEFVALMDKIVCVDGIVIATPTFNFGVPAALKNLLDRMSYKALNPKIINRLHQPTGQLKFLHTYFLVSCGTPWFLLLLAWWTFPVFWLKTVFWYFGAKNWGGIYGAGLNAMHLAKDNPKLLQKCQRAGHKYAKRILTITK